MVGGIAVLQLVMVAFLNCSGSIFGSLGCVLLVLHDVALVCSYLAAWLLVLGARGILFVFGHLPSHTAPVLLVISLPVRSIPLMDNIL